MVVVSPLGSFRDRGGVLTGMSSKRKAALAAVGPTTDAADTQAPKRRKTSVGQMLFMRPF